MEEKIYFTDSNITVSASQITKGNEFYSMRNISSVKIGSVAPKHGTDVFIIALGLFFSLPGLCLLGSDSKGVAVFLLIIGVGLAVLGIYLWTQKKTNYTIVIGTNAGDRKPFSSYNQS